MPLTLHSQQRGEGEPVILLHGLFGDGANLNKLAQCLSEHFAVHNLDLRNHGRSPHHDMLDYPSMMGDVLQYMEQRGIASCALFGHSMGGKVAMSCALNAPERVRALVVGDIAPVRYVPHHKAIFAGLQALDLTEVKDRRGADAFLKSYIPETGVRQFILKSLVNDREYGGLRWRLNVAAIIANYESILAEPFRQDTQASYAGPTLFLRGAESNYILPEHRDQTIEYFPKAELKTIAGASHWLHAEKPDTFNRLCQRFLQESVHAATGGH